MQVLHIENPAGVASKLSTALNRIGISSQVLVTWPNKFQFPVEHENIYTGFNIGTLKAMRRTVRLATTYDLLHVHTGIHWKRLDILDLAIRKRKPLVVHYHGSESRKGYGRYYRSLAKAKVVSTPDLLRYWPDATYIPNPVESGLLEVPLAPIHTPLRLVHLPTDRHIKGTSIIEEAVKQLQGEGAEIDLYIVEGVSHQEAIVALKESDIVLDWISDQKVTGIPGIFGTVSIEAMALGKVAVAYLDPEVKKLLPQDLPVVSPKSPTKVALVNTLRSLLEDDAKTKQLMQRGRTFAQANYHPEVIASRHLEIYRGLLGR